MTILTEPNTGEIRLPADAPPKPAADLGARTQLVRVPLEPTPAASAEERTTRLRPWPRRRPATPDETGPIVFPAADVTATFAIYPDSAGRPVQLGGDRQLDADDLVQPGQPKPTGPLPTPPPAPKVDGQAASHRGPGRHRAPSFWARKRRAR